jgi:hypothetical protein
VPFSVLETFLVRLREGGIITAHKSIDQKKPKVKISPRWKLRIEERATDGCSRSGSPKIKKFRFTHMQSNTF